MHRNRFARWLGALAVVAAPAFAQTIDANDFARRPEAWSASLSPTGAYAAVTVPSDDGLETELHIVRLDGSAKKQVLRFGRMEHVADVTWTADDRVVIARAKMDPLRARPYSTGFLVTTDVNGNNRETLFGYAADKGFLRGRHKDEGWAEVIQVLDEPGIALIDFVCATCGPEPDTVIYRVDTRTGERKEVERGGQLAWYQFDRTGEARIRRTLDDNDNPVLAYRPTKGAPWTQLPKSIAGRMLWGTVWDADNNTVYAFVSDAMEAARPYRIDLAAGTRTALPFVDGEQPEGWLREGHAGVPFAVTYNNEQPALKILKPESPFARLHASLVQAFPGQTVSFQDFSRDDNTVLFSVYSDRNPGEWYLYDRTRKTAQKLVEYRPWLKPAALAPSRPITFTARDGTVLLGLYTANGSGAKPTIVMPHGGPFGIADQWGFDADVQFLASRGYAVLQVNFRGSAGRGEGFMQSGLLGWGERMQDDITDGLKWAIDQHLVDATRVCTYGASFGGYSALMQPIRNPGLYKCAIGYVGVYDLPLMRKTDAQHGGTERSERFWTRTLGSDDAALARISPALRAQDIGVPVMLVHGKDDETADLGQFRAMSAALQRAGKPAEEMLVAGEGHGFVKPENRAELYRRLEAFLGKHLAP